MVRINISSLVSFVSIISPDVLKIGNRNRDLQKPTVGTLDREGLVTLRLWWLRGGCVRFIVQTWRDLSDYLRWMSLWMFLQGLTLVSPWGVHYSRDLDESHNQCYSSKQRTHTWDLLNSGGFCSFHFLVHTLSAVRLQSYSRSLVHSSLYTTHPRPTHLSSSLRGHDSKESPFGNVGDR